MSHPVVGALVGGGLCVLAAPYLARLTHSVPDNDRRDWWRGTATSRTRVAVCAVVAAVFGTLAGAAAGWTALLPAFVLLALCCAPLAVIDYETKRLPNRLVFLAAGGGAVLLTLAATVEHAWHPWLRGLEGAAAVFGVLFTIVFISPRSFGLGDVKVGGVLGGYLGWFGWLYVFYGIFAGFLLGSVVAIALIVTRRGSMKTQMPFGPTLMLGPIVVLAFHLVPSLS